MFSTTPSEEVKKRAQAFFEAFLPEWEKGVTLAEFSEKYGKFHYTTLYYYIKVVCEFDPKKYKQYHQRNTPAIYNRVNPVIKTGKVTHRSTGMKSIEERSVLSIEIERYIGIVKKSLQRVDTVNEKTKKLLGGME